jgi:hypothetical protein
MGDMLTKMTGLYASGELSGLFYNEVRSSKILSGLLISADTSTV